MISKLDWRVHRLDSSVQMATPYQEIQRNPKTANMEMVGKQILKQKIQIL